MPTITFTGNDVIETLTLDDETTIEEVEGILAAMMGLDKSFSWFVDGRVLQTSEKTASIKSLSLVDGSLVTLGQERRRIEEDSTRNVRLRPNVPMYYEGMSTNEILHFNPNPLHAAQIFRTQAAALRELGFHNHKLADDLKNASTDEEAADKLRELLLAQSFERSIKQIEEQNHEENIRQRLAMNPNDQEAQKFIEDKKNQELIDEQHATLMTEYPEAFFPVLMLYIETEIHNCRVQAFVDSGAQTSVMTLACAKRCGIDHLIDKRFGSKIVGVGQSQSLGKIHIAPIQIAGTHFPMSVTVMESLGDKNMEFLFGLDMLKRHRFIIDLEKGILSFHGANGLAFTPFLHEKDLPQNKGGTIGFDPSKVEDLSKAEEEQQDENKMVIEQTPVDNEKMAIENQDVVANEQPAQNRTVEIDTGKIQQLVDMGYNVEDVVRILNQVDVLSVLLAQKYVVHIFVIQTRAILRIYSCNTNMSNFTLNPT